MSSMDKQAISQAVERQLPKAVDFLCRLIGTPSLPGESGHKADGNDTLAGAAAQTGHHNSLCHIYSFFPAVKISRFTGSFICR